MKKTSLFIFSLLLFFSHYSAGAPITVENCGQPLYFEHPPQRAIIHDINMAEMAFALNLQDRIVGLTGISGWYKMTPEFQQKMGNIPELAPKYPSLETILSANPDFFFAGWNYGMTVGGEVTPSKLRQYGIPTLVLSESCAVVNHNTDKASMGLLYHDMVTLGKIFNKEHEALTLVNEWKNQLSVLPQPANPSDKTKVFVYDSGEDKPFTSGKYAMPTAIIEAAGARNIMDSLEASWTTTTWESVSMAEPDFIILLDYQDGLSANHLQVFLESHPLMKLTPAVRNHRYLKLQYAELTPGPANIKAIEKLANALYLKD